MVAGKTLPPGIHSFDPNAIDHLRHTIATAEPDNHVAGYCKTPYPCEFKSWCEKQDGDYPAGWLPNGAVVIRHLHENGIYDIRDIPVDMLSSETHLKIRRITIQGQSELEPEASVILQALDYPRYYLDFETINLPIPVWRGSRPNQQHPFQWSCHIQHMHDATEHKQFIDVTGDDPKRKFAEALISGCGSTGPVIVYNQTFEKGVIKNLADTYDDLSEALLAINNRVFDLLPVMKKYYYHPEMKGSWSIKSVLTCLLPALRYSDLGEVKDGLMAQDAYLRITDGKLSADQRDSLKADMLAYCEMDTYAMLAIVNKVCSS